MLNIEPGFIPELLTAPRWHVTYLLLIEWFQTYSVFSFIQAAVRGCSTTCFWSGPALDQDQLVGIHQVWSNVWKGESSKVSAFQTLCWATITQLAQNVSFSPLSQYDVSRDGEPGGGGEYNVQVFAFHALMVKLMCLSDTPVFWISRRLADFHLSLLSTSLLRLDLNRFSHSCTLCLPLFTISMFLFKDFLFLFKKCKHHLWSAALHFL